MPQRQDVRHRFVFAAVRAQTRPLARSCGSTSTACPKASCRAATWSTAAPRCPNNLVVFATLDAQIVALDQNTGKTVWKEKIDDYAAGYSSTAAPIIVQRADPHRRVGWRVRRRRPRRSARRQDRAHGLEPPDGGRPHGLQLRQGRQQRENGISGTTNQSWPGDLWKTGGAATWLGWHLQPRKPSWSTSAPATLLRGTAICERATTCTPARHWPSTRTRARSSGTTRIRPTTDGTSTASTSSSPSRRTMDGSWEARRIATASST